MAMRTCENDSGLKSFCGSCKYYLKRNYMHIYSSLIVSPFCYRSKYVDRGVAKKKLREAKNPHEIISTINNN